MPDKRLKILSDIGGSARIIPTTVEFVDIAGLVKGASKGEGLGNKFLAKIRECDSIVQVHFGAHLSSRFRHRPPAWLLCVVVCVYLCAWW